MTQLPARRVAHLCLSLLACLALAGCSSEGTFSVCGVTASITAPSAAPAARIGAADLVPAMRYHGSASTDSAWRERVVQELTNVRADTTVRVLFVHRTSVAADDRTRITTAGGTIVEEPAAWNGIVASFTVAAIRAYVPTVSLDRVMDGHVVRDRVLPPCD
jgi:hypothetical protein